MTKIETYEELMKETGWRLTPLNGKVPIQKNWQRGCEEKRPFNRADYKNGRNAGIPCGPANGILVFDMDHIVKANKWLKERDFELPQTRTHMTGRDRPHYICAYPNNGKRYGNTSVKDPEGEVDPETGKVITIFDIRGVGGQIVCPGSTHPGTGKPYTVRHNIPIAPAPQWLLDLCVQDEPKQKAHPVGNGTLEGLQIPYAVKRLIQEGEVKGRRSEAIMSVLNALTKANATDQAIIDIFEKSPIGEKYREKGRTREKWLLKQVDKCRQGNPTGSGVDVSARVRQYLLDEFHGGVFKLSELRRELNLSEKQYTVARNCIRRMVERGEVEKHGHTLGCYRVVDKKKDCIDWDSIEAKASDIVLPAGLHEVGTIRDGDMIAIAGYKNHAKSAFAIETVRLNLDRFKVHFFITEYRARMKQRLLDFGIDLQHPNLFSYQIEKSDYIPDKIESGEGVLNVIDHLPNLDNFYLVGKTQDEIHRGLDGALCVITHQKKNPDDLDAIGGSFWTITPTLAVTLFWEDAMSYPGRMLIRKGKEPGNGRNSITNLASRYSLSRGCQFEYDASGWKF